MAEPKNPAASPKRIIDVTHADKTSPSDTSKPVIINNRPILKDPMMSAEPAVDEAAPDLVPAAEEPSPISGGEKVVAAATSETEPTEPKAPAPADKTEPEPEPDIKAKDTKTVTTATTDKLPAKTPADTPPDLSRGELSADPEISDDIEASKQAEHEAAVQKLIDAKQYYLPIETLEHRRSKRFVALGIVLSLVLAVAWADVALDAHLIQIHGVKPATHFFSN